MPNKQRTLKAIAELSAPGTFTEGVVNIKIHPSEAGAGIEFRIVSGGKITSIPVEIGNLLEAPNRSVLVSPEDETIRINITEHVLSSLMGLGIDNAIIEVDAIEMPLIDGSSLKYAEAIMKVGIVEQEPERDEIVVDETIIVDDGNTVLMAVPSEKFIVTHYLDHENSQIGKRAATIEITPENYMKRIGPARTFLMADNIPAMVANGEVKNTDTNQALVVYEDKLNQTLRFANEFCYHKILDILGDMYLTGKRVRGHIIGIRSGHVQNRDLARRLAQIYL